MAHRYGRPPSIPLLFIQMGLILQLVVSGMGVLGFPRYALASLASRRHQTEPTCLAIEITAHFLQVSSTAAPERTSGSEAGVVIPAAAHH